MSISIIPNADKAVVDLNKLQNYCLNLNHRVGKHKARLFLSILGMKTDDADELRKIILRAITTQSASIGRKDKFGQRYTLDFNLMWNNKSATIRSGWIIENNSNIPKLTTCYPLKNND